MKHAGGGTRIVINPAELRRGAKRLRDLAGDTKTAATRLRTAPTPVTAPEVAGVPEAVHQVGSSLDALVEPLTSSAVELDRRALWAEIADELIAGVPLTAAQLAEFMAGLRDGTLVKYAEPWQANLAGEWLGAQYRSNFTDPTKLRELVTLLKQNGGIYDEQHGAFFAGFINTFGPTNVAHIARVIQEMEMPGAYGTVDGWHDNDRWYGYFNDDVRLDEKDAMDFMLTFGMAVAVATYTGQLTRYAPGAEEKIGYDPDAWSVAQLLAYRGPFGATFLRDVFQNGVIAEIGRQAGHPGGPLPWQMEIRIGDITNDQTRLILDALARNPHAVALALSDPVPEQLQISYKLEGNDNAIAILYDHMEWEDDGEEFARLYQTGIDWCYANGDELRAFGMTQSLLDRTLNSDWRHYDVMTTTLAHDLADHHMADLHLSASGVPVGGVPDDYKLGWAGSIVIDGVRGDHMLIPKDDLESLFQFLADRPQDEAIVLDAAREYQQLLIAENATLSSNDPAAKLEWAKQIGSFDGILMSAHGMERADDFDAENFKHQMLFKFIDSVVGLGLEKHPVYGAGADFLLSGIDEATKPSFAVLVETADDEKEALQRAMHAAIVSGYYENDVRGPNGEKLDPPASILVNGHLVPFLELEDPDKIRQFLMWVETDDTVDLIAGEAVDRADQARENRVPPPVPR